MPRCEKCRKKTSMPIQCKYCKKEHCMSCRYEDVHKCEKINIMKEDKIMILEKTLMNQKTNSKKIVKI